MCKCPANANGRHAYVVEHVTVGPYGYTTKWCSGCYHVPAEAAARKRAALEAIAYKPCAPRMIGMQE